MEYLGLITNSENKVKSLSNVKKQEINSLCTIVLNKDFQVIGKVASLLGKMYSFSAVQFVRWHYWALQNPSLHMKNRRVISIISIGDLSYPHLGMIA